MHTEGSLRDEILKCENNSFCGASTLELMHKNE